MLQPDYLAHDGGVETYSSGRPGNHRDLGRARMVDIGAPQQLPEKRPSAHDLKELPPSLRLPRQAGCLRRPTPG